MVWQILFIAVIISGHVSPSHQWFEQCDQTISLQVGYSQTIQSANWPNGNITAGSSCRWVFQAPGEYQVQAQCYIKFDSTSMCPNQRLYNNNDGVRDPNSAYYYCGQQSRTFVSNNNQMMLAYLSNINGGQFQCTITPICDCGWFSTSRIVNGTDAGQTEFPAMASIYNSNTKKHFCGATIIASTFVMTAAHCLYAFPSQYLQVGVGYYYTNQPNAYQQLYTVSRFIVNPQYNSQTHYNDVALVQVNGRFNWSPAVAAACLPLYYPYYDFSNQIVTATGWGMDELGGRLATTLQKVDLNTLTNADCQQYQTSPLADSQICTYAQYKDTCQSDSGGPLWYRTSKSSRLFNVGIVSYGVGCASPTPGVNTRTTSYMPWIEQNTGTLCRRPLS